MVNPLRYRARIIGEGTEPGKLAAWFKLRKTLFVDLRGWQLDVTDEAERDAFDTPSATHVLLYRDDELIGGFRATRTDQPYLSRSVFPHLALTRPFPQRHDCWEISRFGILPVERQLEAARVNYALMFEFARRRRSHSLVAVADLPYERFLRTLGIATRRYGPPQTVGTDRDGCAIVAVAGEIALADQHGSRFITLMHHLN